MWSLRRSEAFLAPPQPFVACIDDAPLYISVLPPFAPLPWARVSSRNGSNWSPPPLHCVASFKLLRTGAAAWTAPISQARRIIGGVGGRHAFEPATHGRRQPCQGASVSYTGSSALERR